MEVKVLDKNGKDTGRKVQLSDSVFEIGRASCRERVW